MKKLYALCGLCAGAALLTGLEARDTTAPPTRVAAVTDVYHGVSVSDPYRWLENGSDPEVRSWTAAQTQRTRAYLDGLPYRTALANRLMSLTSTASPSYGDLKAVGGHLFARYVDPAKQQPMLAVMGAGRDQSARVPRSERARSDRRHGDRLVRAVARRPPRGRVAVARRQRGRRSARLRGGHRAADRRSHPACAVPDGWRRRGVDRRRRRSLVHAFPRRRASRGRSALLSNGLVPSDRHRRVRPIARCSATACRASPKSRWTIRRSRARCSSPWPMATAASSRTTCSSAAARSTRSRNSTTTWNMRRSGRTAGSIWCPSGTRRNGGSSSWRPATTRSPMAACWCPKAPTSSRPNSPAKIRSRLSAGRWRSATWPADHRSCGCSISTAGRAATLNCRRSRRWTRWSRSKAISFTASKPT